VVGPAELKGYELRWHKLSKKDGSGKCDVVSSAIPNAAVLGVLYEIAEGDRAALDREEGLHKGYDATEVQVLLNGVLKVARSYQATEINSTLQPHTWYRALVVAGAREHGLPANYIARLEAVPATDDQDRARHDRNMCLITEAQT
jgi:gamma-glutamylcyclotransferase